MRPIVLAHDLAGRVHDTRGTHPTTSTFPSVEGPTDTPRTAAVSCHVELVGTGRVSAALVERVRHQDNATAVVRLRGPAAAPVLQREIGGREDVLVGVNDAEGRPAAVEQGVIVLEVPLQVPLRQELVDARTRPRAPRPPCSLGPASASTCSLSGRCKAPIHSRSGGGNRRRSGTPSRRYHHRRVHVRDRPVEERLGIVHELFTALCHASPP